MKKYLFIVLTFASLYSYDSRSIGMGGITTIPLNMFGGGQNPAFVDIDDFEIRILGFGGSFDVNKSIKMNLFYSADLPSIFISPYYDGGMGLNAMFKSAQNLFSFGYSLHVRVHGFIITHSDTGNIFALNYGNQITKENVLKFTLVYGHYKGDEYIGSQSNIYRAGTSLQSHFSWVDTTIGYEKIVSTSNYFDKSKDSLGYELNNLFSSPFGLQSGVSYVDNRFVIPRGISFDYQKGVNDAPDWVLQVMQFPIKSISFTLGIYEFILTLGQSHMVFDYVFSKNKFDSINVGIAYDGDEQYALNMSYGIAF